MWFTRRTSTLRTFMRKRRRPFHLRVTLPAVVLSIIIAGVVLSFSTHDPHWLNRAGALVAAVAAIAVLMQISAEIRLEREREAVDIRIGVAEDRALPSTPLDDLEVRLTVNRLQVERSRITHERLQVAVFVVTAAMMGELLHGFGDLIMCHGFTVCAKHETRQVPSQR